MNTEITIENIKIDKITTKYLTEIKKSDADTEAAKWQLIFYLKILKDKGVIRKGKIEFVEKKKNNKKVIEIELDEELENKLQTYIKDITTLIEGKEIPKQSNDKACKKCAYYDYCYI